MSFKHLISSLLIVCLVSFLNACSRNAGGELAADAPADQVPDLVGSYVVNGFDPLGTEYGGHLTITNGQSKGEYHLQWIITGSIQEGSGHLEGNQLIVEWQSIEGFTADRSAGSATYTVTIRGELYGTRTVEGYEGQGTEAAYPNE
jgi:hypothetical protein